MKILIAGGTGYIGLNVAKKLLLLNHEVTAIALDDKSTDLVIPKKLNLYYANYLNLTDDTLKSLFSDIDVFIFASGVDERLSFENPEEAYRKYNIFPMQRFLEFAKNSNCKKALIMGSYFSFFAKNHPKLKLSQNHPYIKSRLEQESLALSYASDQLQIGIFELPYIFGIVKGRKPVWSMFLDMLIKPKIIFFPKGGTTMMTIDQVGYAIVNWIVMDTKTEVIPMGYYNLTWKEMISIMLKALNIEDKKIITLPNFLVQIGLNQRIKEDKRKGVKPGLDPRYLLKILSKKTYIDKKRMVELNVEEQDIEKAIMESMIYALQIKNQAHYDVLDMKSS